MTLTNGLAAWAGLALVVLAPFGAARADYVCRRLDIPGSTDTQLWQINNAGQIAATSNLGGFVYSAGEWQANPQPPVEAGFGGTPTAVMAMALNDFGMLAGQATPAAGGPDQAFVFSGGVFSFVSHPLAGLPNTFARGINNEGIVSLWISNYSNGRTGTGIYNPGPSTLYPAGFTEIQAPPFSDGRLSVRTVVSQMNDAGRVVGSAQYGGHGSFGLIHDPDGTTSIFRVNGVQTRARGINNHGDIAGLVDDPAQAVFKGFVRTSAGDLMVRCPELNAEDEIFPESINDKGIVTGVATDTALNQHGFVAYPSIAAELEDLLEAVEAAGGREDLESKVRSAAKSVLRGKTAAACGKLADFVADVAALSGDELATQLAASFSAEANAVRTSLNCGP